MKGCEREQQLKTRRGKSREVSSRFLSSPFASSSPNRRNSTSNSSTKRDDQNNNGLKVHLGMNKHDRISNGTQVCFGLPNQCSIDVDTNIKHGNMIPAFCEDMGKQQLSALSIARESLHSVLSRLPLKEGAKVNTVSVI